MSTEPDELLTGDDIDAFAISGDHERPPGQPLRTPYPHNMPGRAL